MGEQAGFAERLADELTVYGFEDATESLVLDALACCGLKLAEGNGEASKEFFDQIIATREAS